MSLQTLATQLLNDMLKSSIRLYGIENISIGNLIFLIYSLYAKWSIGFEDEVQQTRDEITQLLDRK